MITALLYLTCLQDGYNLFLMRDFVSRFCSKANFGRQILFESSFGLRFTCSNSNVEINDLDS